MANGKAVIDIIAPNSRTFNMLEFILQQYGKGCFELGRGNRPDLVVVDFDRTDTGTAFRKYRGRFPGIPAVLLLNQPEEYQMLSEESRIGAEFTLLKPFAANDFIAKIDECLGGIPAIQSDANSVIHNGRDVFPGSTGAVAHADNSSNRKAPEVRRKSAVGQERTLPLQTSAGGNRAARPMSRQRNWEALENEEIAYSFAIESDIDMADEASVASVQLKTDNKLLGYFKSAISQQISASSPICFSVRDGLRFQISSYAKTVSVAGDNASLLEIAGQDFGDGQISPESAMHDEDRQNQIEAEAFLWKLALYTYRGYLPAGTDVNQPVYLKYWPNLTRFEPTPNAMRIASLLCRQPVPLAFIVRILNIPQKHVFNFYAAANAAGLAGPAVREVDRMLLPSYPDEPAYLAIQRDAGSAAVPGRKIV